MGMASCLHLIAKRATILIKNSTTTTEHQILISSGVIASYPEFIDIINKDIKNIVRKLKKIIEFNARCTHGENYVRFICSMFGYGLNLVFVLGILLSLLFL